jgi:hypothetical protein
MSEHKPVRGIDHVGFTVPDLDEASRFGRNAVDGYAEISSQ